METILSTFPSFQNTSLFLVSTLWSKPSDFQSDPLQRERIVL